MDYEKNKAWYKEYYQTHLKNNEAYKRQKAAYSKQWKLNHRHPCPTCGKPIDFRAKFCQKHAAHRGKDHYHWKGGRRIERGYVLVMQPNHPRANWQGYVREHIVIWEQANGKPVPSGWIVHHINGIKDDNRPINLVALPNKKHKQLIALKEKKIQELEALLKHQYQLI